MNAKFAELLSETKVKKGILIKMLKKVFKRPREVNVAGMLITICMFALMGYSLYFSYTENPNLPSKSFIENHSDQFQKEFYFSKTYQKYVEVSTGKAYYIVKLPFSTRVVLHSWDFRLSGKN